MGKESQETGLWLGSRGETICLLFGRSGGIFSSVEPRSRLQLSLCKLPMLLAVYIVFPFLNCEVTLDSL